MFWYNSVIMEIRIFSEADVRRAVSFADAITAMEYAFVSYSEKSATVPPVMHLAVPEHRGEIHVKSAHIQRSHECVIKVATGFYLNRLRNLPSGGGLMMLLSAETGYPVAILLEHGYLTDLRTAAAGAVAAKYLAREQVDQVAIIGAGVQGRFQLEALAAVRSFKQVMVYDHHPINIAGYIGEMEGKVHARYVPAATVEEATAGSGIVITCTPSRSPIVRAEWIERGTHITAIGADGPDKQELDTELITAADCLIADSIEQCIEFGEYHHAVQNGSIRKQDIDGELGDVIRRRVAGRTLPDQITICDFTGVGVQDAAIAQLAFQNASAMGLGREF